MAKKSYDSLFKLLLIGDSSVGKTCLIVKYVEGEFNSTFISTIGIDFKIKTIQLKNKVIKLQIWDTAGQERFRTITASYYRGAMGILLVYSITQRSSFENISNWIKAIREHASENVQVIIIGNKADMEEQRVVSTEDGKRVAKEFHTLFVEASAKTGENVEAAFTQLSEEILAKQPGLLNPQQQNSVLGLKSGGAPLPNNQNSSCC